MQCDATLYFLHIELFTGYIGWAILLLGIWVHLIYLHRQGQCMQGVGRGQAHHYNGHHYPVGQIFNTLSLVQFTSLSFTIVPDHDGGRPKQINAWFLYTHMVYL